MTSVEPAAKEKVNESPQTSDTLAERNGLSALQDAEVSKLRRLVTARKKKLSMESVGVFVALLLCWLIGYVRFSVAWVLVVAVAAVFGLHRRISATIDDAAYLTYRWYTKRRAVKTAESAEWLNALVKQWLVFSEAEFSAMLKRKLDAKLEKLAKKTKILDGLSLKSLTFGRQPPYFVGLRTLGGDAGRKKPNVHVENDSSGSSSLVLVIETDLEIRSDDFQLHIDARVKSFRKPVGIVVESLTLNGRLQLIVTFSREVGFPHVARVQATFTERPTVVFDMKLRGLNVMDVPVLRTAVHNMLVDAIAKTMVDPGRLGLLNRFHKLQQNREQKAAADAAAPAGSAAYVASIGVLKVSVRILGSSVPQTASENGPQNMFHSDACICVLKLAEQKASLRFCEVDEDDTLAVSTDDEGEKRALGKGEPLYDSAPVRKEPLNAGLSSALLVRGTDGERFKVRLKHAKHSGSSHKPSLSTNQFGVLASWDLRLGDYLNAMNAPATSSFELAKETKHLGTVRIAIDFNYCPLQALNQSAVTNSKEPKDVVDLSNVRNLLQRGVHSGVLFLTLHCANGLLALDRNGFSDPYCVINLNGRRVRTTPFHPRTCEPQFDYSFELLVDDVRHAELLLELFDYDGEGSSQKSKAKRSSQDDRLGNVRLELREPMALRLVLPLVFSVAPASDETVLPASRKIALPDSLSSKTSSISLAHENANLGTLTLSYVFRPSENTAAFFALPAFEDLDDEVSVVSQVISNTEPPSGRKHGHKSSKRDQTNVAELLRKGLGLMEIRIVEARKLIAKDLNGRSDPFCVLCIGEETLFKTKTRHATLSPFWNETVTCRMPADGETLQLTVYDKDTFGRDFLGTLALSKDSIHSAASSKAQEPPKVWYSLTGVRTGEVCLAFRIIFDPKTSKDEVDAGEFADALSVTDDGENLPRVPPRTGSISENLSMAQPPEISVASGESFDAPRPSRPPPRSRNGLQRSGSSGSAKASSQDSASEDGVPPPVPMRVHSRHSIGGAAPNTSGHSDDSTPENSSPSRPELPKKGELRKVSVSDDASRFSLQAASPRPPSNLGYSRLRGSIIALRGLQFKHFLSQKERERVQSVEHGSSASESDRLVAALQNSTVTLKIKLQSKLPDDTPALTAPRSTSDSMTVAHSHPIRFSHVCNDMTHPFATATAEREVPLTLQFDVPASSAKQSLLHPAAVITISLKRKKQQPLVRKSFQLSWLFAASDIVEPTWLNLDDDVAVRLSLFASRRQLNEADANASSSTAESVRHRGVKQSFRELFSSKDH